MIFPQLPYSELILHVHLYLTRDKTVIYAKPIGSCKLEIAKGVLLQNFCVSEKWLREIL